MPTLTVTTEADLIAACVRGEHRAQRQLYDQLAGLMLTVCRRYLKRREEAEEALILGFAKMFRALPTGYRTVFNLYALEGYGHQEIAELLGISEGTSKSQLSKARAMLQRRVQFSAISAN